MSKSLLTTIETVAAKEGKSVWQLTSEIGLNQGNISNWRRGKNRASVKTTEKVLKALNQRNGHAIETGFSVAKEEKEHDLMQAVLACNLSDFQKIAVLKSLSK
jgi:transcriptional regulator with XRE-family HTH domain